MNKKIVFVIFLFLIWGTFDIRQVDSASTEWSFSNTNDYTYDTESIEITSGNVSLKQTSNWFSDSWNYRKQIIIDNQLSENSLSNYQINLDVIYEGEMNSDFSDLRFTDSSGTTTIDFYIEEVIESVSSSVWVELPTLDANSTTSIYAYYGNSSVSSTSNSETTFIFSADFEDEVRNCDEIYTGFRGCPVSRIPENPVLEKGNPGDWDDYGIRDPWLLVDTNGDLVQENGAYVMYYNGRTTDGGTVTGIGRATSTDGIVWNKDTNNPILTDNSNYAAMASVIKRAVGDYIMYYSTNDATQIAYAESVDGVNWVASGNNPVLVSADFTNSPSTGLPVISMLDDGTYFMVFEGIDGGFNIYAATSPDGETWTPANSGNAIYSGTAGDWDRDSVANPKFYEFGTNEYLIVYNGHRGNGRWEIGYLLSSDLENWTQYDANPVLRLGESGAWDDRRIEGGIIAKDEVGEDNIKFWYFGLPTSDSYQDGAIGYAVIDQTISVTTTPYNFTSNWADTDEVIPFQNTTTARYGEKAMAYTDDSAVSARSIIASFYPAQTNLVVDFSINPQQANQTGYVRLKSGNNIAVNIQFSSVGKIQYYDGVWNDLINYESNTWYDFKLDINTITDTYDIYINNVLIKAGASFWINVDDLYNFEIAGKTADIGTWILDGLYVRQTHDISVSTNFSGSNTIFTTSSPSIEAKASIAQQITTISGFTETSTKDDGEIYYVLSNDGGINWYYYNDGWKVSNETVDQAVTASVINSNAGTFPMGDGNFIFKSYLSSDGDNDVILSAVGLTYNRAPTGLSLSLQSIEENSPVGTQVGTFSVTDFDSLDTHTYRFCGGEDDALFSISNASLSSGTVFDYEKKSSYTVCILSTDNAGATTTQSFVITITDVSEGFGIIQPILQNSNVAKYNVEINNGADITNEYVVSLDIRGNTENLVHMAISNNESFKEANFQVFNSKINNWTLDQSLEKGKEGIVYVRLRAEDGSYVTISDTIMLGEVEEATVEKGILDCSLDISRAYKSATGPAVYMVTNAHAADGSLTGGVCTKRAFQRSDVFFTYFDSWSDVVVDEKILDIEKDALGFMPWGPTYDPQYGALVKVVSDPKVYLLLGESKYWITSENVFTELGYKWHWVEDIDASLLDSYATGSEITATDVHPNYTLVKYADSPRVYRLEPDPQDSGKTVKRYIPNEAIFESLQYRWDRIVTIPKEEQYEDGLPCCRQ